MCKRTTKCSRLFLSGVKSVSGHEEASAGGCYFAWHGGIIAQQNLANYGNSTCHSISTNLPSGWLNTGGP